MIKVAGENFRQTKPVEAFQKDHSDRKSTKMKELPILIVSKDTHTPQYYLRAQFLALYFFTE